MGNWIALFKEMRIYNHNSKNIGISLLQHGRFRCGCRDELVCKKTGYFLKKCVKDEGSGDDDFLY